MPSPHEPAAPRLIHIGLFTALGLVLFLFESLLPRPLPWIKPGLANIATMVALYALDGSAAWAVAMLRCAVASLVGGSFFNPAFWLSLSGSAASVFTMALGRRYAAKIFSMIGISLLGALAHLVAQLAVASALIVQDARVVVLLPTMLLASVFTGLIVGYASLLILSRIAPDRVRPRRTDWPARAFDDKMDDLLR